MTASQPASASRTQSWFRARKLWSRQGIALLAGAAATLGHAPFQLTLVYIAAITVLIWLLDVSATKRARLRSAFAMGWFFGFGHMVSGLHWIAYAFDVDTDAWGPIWGIPATVGLAAFLALFWGLGCVGAILLWTNDARRIFWFALCLFATEWLRGHSLFGGFPWLLPGYVWTPGEPVSQIASVIGIYGVSLLTLLMGAAPAVIADGHKAPMRRFAPTVTAALAVGMLWGWGAQRIANAPVDPPGAQPIIRVADPGLSQEEKWRYRPDQEWRVLSRYLEVSGPPDDSRDSILVWPEGAIPTLNFFMLDNPQFLAAIGQGLGDRALIVGSSRCEPRPACDAYMRGEGGPDRLRLYNSAAIIDGVSGAPRLSQTYDKHTLVPFGEYIPFWSLVGQLNIAPLQRIGAGFTPGAAPTRLVVPEAPPAIVLICYEAIFPDTIPRGEDRPGWIVSITNDAWFGGGIGPLQHYAQTRYRAIEEGLPLARAASGGVSAIVDAFGREVRATHGRAGAAEAQLPRTLPATPLARFGDTFLAILLVFVAFIRFFPARLLRKEVVP